MSASNEWEDVHLTPAGWVDGSIKRDFAGVTKRPVPADAVLTAHRRVHVASAFSSPDISESETRLTDDVALIEELRQKYGKPVFGV
ncbi:translation initiation factor 1 [Cupriavidus plantarum]|uniref:translation initiation factor 1 n=1 Tax=Cupriavidus plantarum TaxID=942865 RepID=UPI0015CD7788|nr:translation initiation factor 1 [Cupriavidus plantarum]NYI02889.1 hypothetical protein [Cupriavidus plantarum]